jgi:ubiquitin
MKQKIRVWCHQSMCDENGHFKGFISASTDGVMTFMPKKKVKTFGTIKECQVKDLKYIATLKEEAKQILQKKARNHKDCRPKGNAFIYCENLSTSIVTRG